MKNSSSQQSAWVEGGQRALARIPTLAGTGAATNQESSHADSNRLPNAMTGSANPKIAKSGATRMINVQAACWLFGSLAILVASLLLNVGEERQVVIPWLQWPLPESCGLRLRFGMDCPGCGLTRSFIYLADGDFSKAWSLHSLGCIIFLYTLAQVPLSLIYARQSITGIQLKYWARIVWVNERLILVLAALLFLRWLWMLAMGEIL